MTRTAANDIDSVASFQKVGAVAQKVAQRWPLETRVQEMLRDPEALRIAHARLIASEGPPALTDRQLDLLRFIRSYQAQKGTSPTQRRMSEGIGASLSHVNQLVAGLEARGAIVKRGRSAQSITLIERAG